MHPANHLPSRSARFFPCAPVLPIGQRSPEQDLARQDLYSALMPLFRLTHPRRTGHGYVEAQLACDAADGLIAGLRPGELDLTQLRDSEATCVQYMSEAAWAALQRFAKSTDGSGIATVLLSSKLRLEPHLLKNLALLNVRRLAVPHAIEPHVRDQLYSEVSSLGEVIERVPASDVLHLLTTATSGAAAAQRATPETLEKICRAWSNLDQQLCAGRVAFDVVKEATERVIALRGAMPWHELEAGLQAAVRRALGTGNQVVLRGVVRAILNDRAVGPKTCPSLSDRQKLLIMTGGCVAVRAEYSPAQPRRASAVAPHVHCANLSSRRGMAAADIRGARAFTPVLGAFAESEEAQPPRLVDSQAAPHLTQIHTPLLHELVNLLPANPNGQRHPAAYSHIAVLLEEVLKSSMDDSAIASAFSSSNRTGTGEETWAQLAMRCGHPGAVAHVHLMVALAESSIKPHLRSRVIEALGVEPDRVVSLMDGAL